VNDGCRTSCIYLNNVHGSASINGGWSFHAGSTANPVIDLENTTNVSVTGHVLYYPSATPGPGITVNNSTAFRLFGNVFSGINTAVNVTSSYDGAISGNVADAVTATNIFNFATGNNNAITGNVLGGTATCGMKFDATSGSQTGLETNQFHFGITTNICDSASNKTVIPTNLQVLGGITNGAGMQHGNTSSTCTTAASVGTGCTFTLTWPVTWADTNYDPVCSIVGATSGVPIVQGVSSKATGSMVVSVAALTAVAAQATAVDCVALHN
jgi:hypothetical protein